MINKDYWDHFGPNGETPWEFIRHSGYDPYKHAGENLAKGFITAEGVHQAWMASPTHRANIISEDYQDIGVAVINGKLQGENVTLVVQMFGTLAKTATLTQTADPEISNVGEGQGILSIKITYPEQNQVLNNPAIEFKGVIGADSEIDIEKSERENIDLRDEIELFEANKLLDTIKIDSGAWNSDTLDLFKDGLHKVKVQLKSDSTVTDEVRFTVDTTGPLIQDDQLTLDKVDQNIVITYRPSERDVSSLILAGRKVHIMENKDGILSASIPADEIPLLIKLIATDRNGNSAERVIETDAQLNSSVGVLGIFTTGTQVKQIINIAFAVGMLVILLAQIYSYNRLKLLEHKAGYLFTVIIWISLIVLSTVIRSVGVIS